MKSIIMIDSGADLPKSYIKEHNLAFAPLSYSIDDKDYYDDMGESLSYSQFYQMLSDQHISKTSQVTPNKFVEIMTPYLDDGNDILSLSFSSSISGTYQSSLVAAESLLEKYPERRIICVDTLCASIGTGLIIDYAVKMLDDGKDIEEIAAWVNANKNKVHHWITVDDINHLFRGGRVDRSAAIAGSLLSIKPIIFIDTAGKLAPVGNARGRRRSLRELVDRMEENGENLKDQPVFISHGDCIDDANYVADLIRERFGNSNIFINYMGAIIGTHTGPGAVILTFMGKNREDLKLNTQ